MLKLLLYLQLSCMLGITLYVIRWVAYPKAIESPHSYKRLKRRIWKWYRHRGYDLLMGLLSSSFIPVLILGVGVVFFFRLLWWLDAHGLIWW